MDAARINFMDTTGRGELENVLGQEEREDWTEDPMDGAEGQAWLKPDELGDESGGSPRRPTTTGRPPNDVQQ